MLCETKTVLTNGNYTEKVWDFKVFRIPVVFYEYFRIMFNCVGGKS